MWNVNHSKLSYLIKTEKVVRVEKKCEKVYCTETFFIWMNIHTNVIKRKYCDKHAVQRNLGSLKNV